MGGRIKMSSSSVATTSLSATAFQMLKQIKSLEKEHKEAEGDKKLKICCEISKLNLSILDFSMTIDINYCKWPYQYEYKCDMALSNERRKTTTTILFNKLPIDIIRLIFQYEEDEENTCYFCNKKSRNGRLFSNTNCPHKVNRYEYYYLGDFKKPEHEWDTDKDVLCCRDCFDKRQKICSRCDNYFRIEDIDDFFKEECIESCLCGDCVLINDDSDDEDDDEDDE